jgi:hypothetical protein
MTTERYIQNINRDLGAVMNLFSEKGVQEEGHEDEKESK